jgi:hypothetical protein
MSEEPRDRSLLIGLHKLAEQNGDGLVPELFALLSRREEYSLPSGGNVLAFPAAAKSAAPSSDQPPSSVGDARGVVVPMRRP